VAARLADHHGLPPFLPGYSVGDQMEHGARAFCLEAIELWFPLLIYSGAGMATWRAHRHGWLES